MIDLQKLDFRKNKVIDLKNATGLGTQKASVVLVMDKSGSMETMFKNGTVQSLVERVLPLGLAFDDDQKVEYYIFHNEAWKHPEDISVSNLETIIPDTIRKYGYGGTSYAPAIALILDEWVGKKSGLFSKSRPKKSFKDPVYVIYITDGQNDDKAATEAILRESSNFPIYFQFVGIGKASFAFLEKLDDLSGRTIDNAGFFQVNDLSQIGDDELYQRMLKEFPQFVTEVRQKNWIQ